MAGGQRKTERREPVFGAGADLHADPAERRSRPNAPRKRKRRRKSKTRNVRGLVSRLAYWVVVLGLWCGIAGAGAVVWVGAHLPPIQSLEIPKRPPSISILDDHMQMLATRGDAGGGNLKIEDLPPYLPKAFVAIEDRRFYEHYGIDPIGIARAAVANILHRGVAQGGSTLTQQLAKNLFLTPERSLERKLQEALLALWLERKFTKNEILELYLNRVYFGSGAYGVEQAAQRYFGKSARHVTLAEAAMLAGLVKSPSRLAPNHNYKAAEQRARVVLGAMQDAGFITAGSEKLALAHPPAIVAQKATGSVQYVADWVMDAVNDRIGHIDSDLVVVTTIDGGLQAKAEQALTDELAAKGGKYGVSEGALVSMTPTGAVRALIGGRNYAQSQFNRAVAAKRQPGSAFKPFVYLTALEHGLTPDSIRDDRPINVKGWRPENYEHEYLGPVPLSTALAKSLNTVSVRLTLEFGPAAVVRTAHRLGITSQLEPNASIALGTSEVSPLELVGAYSTFANGGYATQPYVIRRISTPEGKVLYARAEEQPARVVDPRTIGMMNAMMQQTLTIGTARSADLPGWQAAGKTGTSQDFRDAWFIGFTSNLVTGVWLGNDDGSPTHKTTGGSLPVAIWSRFMKGAEQGVTPQPLPGSYDQGSPGLLSSLFGGSSGAPTPPAPIAAKPRQTTGSGIDSWLLDGLFSR
jgi:penicillin-binding protein 1A